MPDIETIRVVLPDTQNIRVSVDDPGSPQVEVIRVMGFAAGGSNANFTLNASTGSVSLVAGNNITLQSNASTITIVGGAGGGGNDFTLNGSTGSASLVAGDGISLASNLSTITVSNSKAYSTLSGSMIGQNIPLEGTTVTIGNNFQISGFGIISVGATGNTIKIAAITEGVLTFVTNSLSASGNTTGVSSSGTYNSVLALSGAGIVSVGAGNGSFTISATTPSVVSAIGTAGATSNGTILFAAGNNITLNTGASSITIVGPTVPAATNFVLNGTSSSVSISAGAGIGIGQANSTITISASNVVSAFGTGAATSTGIIVLAAGNNITLNTGINSITIVGPTVPAATNFVLNGTSSSVSISAGAGIGIGQANSTITVSASVQTSSLSATALGNTLGVGSTSLAVSNVLNFSGGGIVSVGMNASTITISATTPSVTNFSTISLSASGNTTGATSSGTMNNVLAMSGMGIVSVGGGNGTFSISATTPSVTNYSTISGNIAGNTAGSSTFTIGNTLQISLTGGLSGTASGSSITLSAAAAAGAGTQSFSGGGTSVTGTAISVALVGGNNISLASASAAGSLTLTIHGSANAINNVSSLNGSSGALSISAGAGIGIGQANSTVTISASVQTASASLTALGNTTGSSAGTFTNLLNVSGAGGVSVGVGAQSITVSGPSQTTLVAGTNISLTSGGSSITIINTGPAVSLLQNCNLVQAAGTIVTKAGTVTGTAGVGSSLFLQRLSVPGLVSLSEIDAAMSIGFPATNQGAGTMSRSMVIYSFGNSTSLASVMSASGTSAWNTGTSTAGASTSLTQFQGGWSSPLIQPMTFATTSLAGGDYVVGQLFNFAQGSSTWTLAFYGAQGMSSALATASTFATAAGSGVTGTLAASGFSATIAASAYSATVAGSGISAITQNATNNISWFVSRATSAVTSVASATSSFTFLEAPFVGSIGTVAGSLITGANVVGSMISGALIAGSLITGVQAGSVISAAGSSSSTLAQMALPNFGYIGTGSTTSGFPTAFIAGIMSTGAVPTAITLTSTAVTYSGSIAFQQPWFALVAS